MQARERFPAGISRLVEDLRDIVDLNRCTHLVLLLTKPLKNKTSLRVIPWLAGESGQGK
jgi:hypothetical protein